MKKTTLGITVLLFSIATAAAGSYAISGEQDLLPTRVYASEINTDAIFSSYYGDESTTAYRYFQNKSINRFLAGWVKYATGIENPTWDYTSLAPVQVLDHDFNILQPDKQLYSLLFSDGGGRNGYALVIYNENDPSIQNWGIYETTPHSYDLKANYDKIEANLLKTDIDMSTAAASRVYLYDKEYKRASQIILFTDENGNKYICNLDDASFEITRVNTP